MCVNPLYTMAICFFLGIFGATGLMLTGHHSLIHLEVRVIYRTEKIYLCMWLRVFDAAKQELILLITFKPAYLPFKIFSAVMGMSYSSMFATGILWSERYISINNRIGAAFSISGVSMQNALQAIVGQSKFP